MIPPLASSKKNKLGTRQILGALSALFFLVASIQLYRLPLWSYWSFLWLTSGWLIIIALRWNQFNKRWLLLSTVSGVLLTLGFPVVPIPITLFVAWAFLFQVEHEIAKARLAGDKNKSSRFTLYAYNTFVIWNIGVTWWVANSGLIPGLIANFLNAFFMMSVVWAAHRATRNTYFFERPTLKYILFACAFMSFEYLHLNWDISWSWLNVGNAFSSVPSLIQWYEYTGVFGGALWVWVFNIFAWSAFQKNKINLRDKTIFASLIVIPVLISFAILFSRQSEFKNSLSILKEQEKIVSDSSVNTTRNASLKKISVAVVQPNFEPHYEKFIVPEEVQLQKFLRLSQSIVDSTTDYLVYPETSFIFRSIETAETNPNTLALKDFTRRFKKLNIVLGIETTRTYSAHTTLRYPNRPFTVRELNYGDGTYTYWEEYDAATQINNATSPMPLYKKSKFVPGPEVMPYPKVFGFLVPLFEKMGGSINGLGEQPERSVFVSADKKNKVAPVICYESIFGEYCTGYVRNGADALFVVTNDGWWDATPGYQQHADFARLRAIELRRPVAQSGNSGRSCFIDIFGNETKATTYGVDAAIKQDIFAPSTITFYTLHGDLIARMAIIMAAAIFTFSLVIQFKTKN